MAPQHPTTQREQLQQKYNSGRANLLLMIAFTAVNIVLLVTGSETMFLFSATIPYVASIDAMMAVEYGLAANMPIFVICTAIAAVSILLYLLCWWLSKKRSGWLITALVLFALDTLYMGYLYATMLDTSGIVDMLVHVWVIYYLILGISSGAKLKKLSDTPINTAVSEGGMSLTEDGATETMPTSSTGLYPADDTVKARILAEVDAAGHHIVYRRVKQVNELVVDGYVYDTYEALMEQPHTLRATRNGTVIECGTNAASRIFINVDGETLVKKFRLV